MNNPNENMITKYDQCGEIELIEDDKSLWLEYLHLQMQINNLSLRMDDHYALTEWVYTYMFYIN